MIEKCDEDISKIDSGVDVRLSGTTCVCIYMDEHSIHVGSVGDSRSVLGTTPGQNEEIPQTIRSRIGLEDQSSQGPGLQFYLLQLTRSQIIRRSLTES